MKKKITVVITMGMCLAFGACNSLGQGYNTVPYDEISEEGESFSDYVKDEDPELYDSMEERYNNMTSGY